MRRPQRARRVTRSRGAPRQCVEKIVVLALIAGACSSAVTPPEPDCQDNSDCESGEICSIEQGGYCVKAILPDSKDVGLVINEIARVDGDTPFTAEVLGIDASVTIDRSSFPERFILNKNNQTRDGFPYPGIRGILEFKVLAHSFFAKQDATPENPYEPKLLQGTVVVSQDSRLSRAATSANANYPPVVQEGDDPIEKIVVPWQHLTSTDTSSDQPVVVTLAPTSASEIPQSNVYRQIHVDAMVGEEAQAKAIDLEYYEECLRNIIVASRVLGVGIEPPEIASVSVRYVSPVSDPKTVVNCPEDGCSCEDDADCGLKQVCNVADNRCALDLTGRTATSSAKIDVQPDNLLITSNVYTYCDSKVGESSKLDLAFTVTPGPDTGLPRLTYLAAEQEFGPPDAENDLLPDLTLPDPLCLPNWLPAQDISFVPTGQPKSVGQRNQLNVQDFVCCHVNCLQGENPEPPSEQSCAPDVSATFVGTFTVPDTPGDNWDTYDCLPLYSFSDPEEEVTSVRFNRSAAYDEMIAKYTAKLSPGQVEEPLTYDVRIEPEVGSIFRSTLRTVAITPQTTELSEMALLDYRVQLRGKVRPEQALCTESSECVISREAEVVAERIRLASEEGSTVLGPYVYRTQTFANGEFTLPVNPGVYLLSAFPAIGSQGAPSEVFVVDLRLESDEVNIREDGVPEAELNPLLTEGRLATLELRNIDRSASVTPIDRGSWEGLMFENSPLDLNSATTCYGSEGRGCRIRQLVFGDADLFPDQDGFVTYSSRG